jgi:ABC-type siderophore export system fused ATPase/permease subunit
MNNPEKVESDVPPDQVATLPEHLATPLASSLNIKSTPAIMTPTSATVNTVSVCNDSSFLTILSQFIFQCTVILITVTIRLMALRLTEPFA